MQPDTIHIGRLNISFIYSGDACLAQNSQLVDLNIERWFRISHPKYSYKDRLLIGGRSDGNVLFVSESTVSDPVLLDLQERALERLGIEVN